jgi:hypothetical protein
MIVKSTEALPEFRWLKKPDGSVILQQIHEVRSYDQDFHWMKTTKVWEDVKIIEEGSVEYHDDV